MTIEVDLGKVEENVTSQHVCDFCGEKLETEKKAFKHVAEEHREKVK